MYFHAEFTRDTRIQTLGKNSLSGRVHNGNPQWPKDETDHNVAPSTVKLVAFGDTPSHSVSPVHVILKHNKVMGMSQKLEYQ